MWNVLPNEMLHLIFQFLNWSDLRNVSLVSSKFNELVSIKHNDVYSLLDQCKYQWTKGKKIFKIPCAVKKDYKIILDNKRILIIFEPSVCRVSDLCCYSYDMETGKTVKEID